MPTVNVKRDVLFQLIGKEYTEEQFDALCFEFGIELDEVTSEKQIALKECGTIESDPPAKSNDISSTDHSEDIIYKIDVPANRYDLLSVEGLSQALSIFQGLVSPPSYKTLSSQLDSNLFSVDQHVMNIRSVLVGAVIKGVNLSQQVLDSFIDLQDKLHQNIGRKRALVSIGTHDLDKITGPFRYTACPPNQLKFVPLNQTKEYTGLEMMDLYSDSHLKQYLHLIRDKPRYPVIYDKNNVVLSMPPIINGNVSKLTLDTKNILIEITATDRAKAIIALDTIVTMLISSTAVKNPYVVEQISVVYPDGRKYATPNLDYHSETISPNYINGHLGLNLSDEEISTLLIRMGIRARPIERVNKKLIEVDIPPTRHDILNDCDIMEDVGIAYGYDNIPQTLPKCATISSQVPINKLSNLVRHETSRCGYTEALTFALCSEDEISTMLRRPIAINDAVKIQNPKTQEFQVARTSLLPGLLKTISSNKRMPLPIKLFEVSDVVLVDSQKDIGARNERRISAIHYGGKTACFELVHGLLDRLMRFLNVPYCDPTSANKSIGYYIEGSDNEVHLPGRSGVIMCRGRPVGTIGILHPDVLGKFELNLPSSTMELNLENIYIQG
ncbi:Phenylalanine--tRNA ligase beta subunit, partial [Fragariocoptes setiger]